MRWCLRVRFVNSREKLYGSQHLSDTTEIEKYFFMYDLPRYSLILFALRIS